MFRFIKTIFNRYRALITLIAILMVVSSSLEGLGILGLIPLLVSLGITEAPGDGHLYYQLIQLLDRFGLGHTPQVVALTVVGLFILQYVFYLSGSFLASKIQAVYTDEIRRKLFHLLVSSRWAFLQRTKTAEVMNAVTGQTQQVGMALSVLLQFFSNLVNIAVYFSLAVLTSASLTLTMLAVGGLLAFAIKGVMRKAQRLGEENTTESEAIFHWGHQILLGIKFIKATATESVAEKNFNTISKKLERVQFETALLPHFLKTVFELGAVSALVICLAFSKYYFDLPGVSVLIVAGIFYRLYPRVTTLQQNIQTLYSLQPSFRYVDDLENRAKQNQEPQKTGTLPKTVEQARFVEIELKDLSVQFETVEALRGINLKIPRGNLTAIVGPSGSGKTTLLDSLIGLVEPTHGEVIIEDQSLTNLNRKAWRSYVGYVGQDTYLFNETIENNIAWGVLENGTDPKLSAKLANASDFIEKLPQDYQTLVGDSGLTLSGGQRQRIGIARALNRNCKLLIFDEVTSALDAAAEKEILKTIQSLKGKVTMIMVAHRLSAVRDADQIIVLESGKVIQADSWQNLIQQPQGHFAKMWAMQGGQI